MSILRRAGTTAEEREAYLRAPKWRDNDSAEGLSEERYAEIAEKEQFLLTVTENGFGKRSSTYEYRRTNRGGQGITNIVTSDRNGGVVASFPVKPGEQLMLVTDQAKVIRTTVGDIRIAGRNTQGVTIFKIDKNEKVVSVARIDESEEEIELDGGDEHEATPDATVGEDLASGSAD
jgi:DNA gyrase subunit A